MCYSQQLNWRSIVFPVVGTKNPGGSDRTEMERLCGTACSIGGGYFLTAGHVVEAARQSRSFGLGYGVPGKHAVRIAYAGDSEVDDDLDLGVIEPMAEVPRPVTTFLWSTERRSMLHDVQTIGFPHGHDPEQATFTPRAFKGYIVSSHRSSDRANDPRHYELSFSCPKQISGAPVMSLHATGPNKPPMVVGVILGNSETGVTLGGYSEESTGEDGMVERFERTDIKHFGIAISTASMIGFESELLGNTVIKHLRTQGYLQK